MLEAEICQEPEQRDDWHARWLTMQSAYVEYRRSSEALECTRSSTDDPLTDDHLKLAMLEGQQRAAFERYVDARIAFLESRFDEMNRPDAGGMSPTAAGGSDPQRNNSGIKAWLSIASSAPVLQTLGVFLLCTMSFSLLREQKRVHDLETGRDELRAALLRTGHEVQVLEQRVAALVPASPPSPQVQQIPSAVTPVKPPAPRRRAGWKPGTGTTQGQQRVQHAKAAANRTQAPEPSSRNAARASYDFSIAPSREFKRIGPLSVWLKSIDPQKSSVSLSIVSASSEVDVQLLKINQPVWVNTSHGHRVGLIADRISKNRLDGHLVETEGGKPDVATSPARPAIDGAP